MPSTEQFRIGVLGEGTVGRAFIELIEARGHSVEQLTGKRPVITEVLTTSRGSFETIVAESDVVVELIGGTEPAQAYVSKALEAGLPVITANKQLIAQHGTALSALAHEHGVALRFEGAVAGVVPIVRVLTDSLAGSELERVHGIVNGTTNYILSAMAQMGIGYGEALAQAQQLGYAEADPSDDVSGKDAAAKMAILARLAFGADVALTDVRYEGIEEITSEDIAWARELELALKLVGTAERCDDGIAVHVHPALLYPGHPLASVCGAFNAVTVESPAITEITLSGPGAGGAQTASVVLSDLISIMCGQTQTLPALKRYPIVSDVKSAFYVALEVIDQPGVLAEIATTLGGQGASIKSFVQHGLGDQARIVMVVHPLLQSRFFAALKELSELPALRATPRAIRVLDAEFV